MKIRKTSTSVRSIPSNGQENEDADASIQLHHSDGLFVRSTEAMLMRVRTRAMASAVFVQSRKAFQAGARVRPRLQNIGVVVSLGNDSLVVDAWPGKDETYEIQVNPSEQRLSFAHTTWVLFGHLVHVDDHLVHLRASPLWKVYMAWRHEAKKPVHGGPHRPKTSTYLRYLTNSKISPRPPQSAFHCSLPEPVRQDPRYPALWKKERSQIASSLPWPWLLPVVEGGWHAFLAEAFVCVHAPASGFPVVERHFPKAMTAYRQALRDLRQARRQKQADEVLHQIAMINELTANNRKGWSAEKIEEEASSMSWHPFSRNLLRSKMGIPEIEEAA